MKTTQKKSEGLEKMVRHPLFQDAARLGVEALRLHLEARHQERRNAEEKIRMEESAAYVKALTEWGRSEADPEMRRAFADRFLDVFSRVMAERFKGDAQEI
jgi:hypothetical protein